MNNIEYRFSEDEEIEIKEYLKGLTTEKKVFVDDFTLDEFCGIVGKSKRTIARKISQGKINPRIIKSKQGTVEYRFSEDNVKAFFWDELPLSIKSNR